MASIEIRTDITGTVWKLVAVPGAILEEDEPILLVESMKMEIPIGAPEAGQLIEILAAEGDTVTEGMVFARMEAGAARPPGSCSSPIAARLRSASSGPARRSVSAPSLYIPRRMPGAAMWRPPTRAG
jgi:acetyl-CoA carboxylase biotin carboxyl carrier protein